MYPKLLSVKWGRFNDQAETATRRLSGMSRLVVCLLTALSPDPKKDPLNRHQPIACNPENPQIL